MIRNREKDKYYVGQSKDVMKRIRQHFKGTVPANVIFAEDYYTSTFINKEDLFEVKIIPCETKDELDDTERDLIKKYDSFQSGYNGTGGNKELIRLINVDPDYAIKNFQFSILEVFLNQDSNNEQIREREIYWKKVLDSKNHGYNDNF